MNKVLSILIVAGASTTASANEVFTVCSTGCDFPTVQEAIDHAGPGDTIEVLAGSYPGFELHDKHLTISGERDEAGQLLTHVAGIEIVSETTGLTRIEHLQVTTPGITTVLSSPAIVGCSFDGLTIDEYGGALRSIGGQPSIDTCTFENCHAGFKGGAVSLYLNAEASISDCEFRDNTASDAGGAIEIAAGSQATITGCRFEDNQSALGPSIFIDRTSSTTVADSAFCPAGPDEIAGPWLDAGGNSFDPTECADQVIWVSSDGTGDYTSLRHALDNAAPGSTIFVSAGTYEELGNTTNTVDLQDVSIIGVAGARNTVLTVSGVPNDETGYINLAEKSSIYISGITFVQDPTDSSPGGSCIYARNSSCTIDYCRIEGFSLRGGGGAIRIDGGTLHVAHCDFLSNRGTEYFNSNYSRGGAIRATNCNTVAIMSSDFTGNSAAAGYGGDAGAVRISGARISILDCNFTANRAIDTGGTDTSGASTAWISVTNSPSAFALVERCNFSGGQGRLSTLRLSNNPGNVAPMIVRDSTFSNSQAIWGGSVLSEGFTVIDGCYFAESGNGAEGHSLEPGSPTEVLNCEFETCCPARSPDNITYLSGTLGYQCAGREADVDCNGVVNSSDLGLLLALWGSTDQRGDLDGDGNVDAGDLGALLAQWQ